MGNTIKSDASYGNVWIELEKSVYMAGEQVNGICHVYLKKPFPSTELKLIITGKTLAQLTEVQHKTRYNYSTKSMESYSETVVHKGEKSFFGYTFPLFTYSGQFEQGQCSYPFSFKLTDNIPGSFYQEFQQDGYKNFGQIVYNVWAGMQSHQNSKVMVFNETVFRVDQCSL